MKRYELKSDILTLPTLSLISSAKMSPINHGRDFGPFGEHNLLSNVDHLIFVKINEVYYDGQNN